MIYLYRVLHIILLPLTFVYLAFRLIIGKEDRSRFKERLGVASLNRDSNKKLIWIHCASVGESISVLPMIKRLARTKNTNVLVTTGTVTSANLLADKLPKNTFHQYIPVDFYPFVKKFINYWQPDVSVFVESDLWPELIYSSNNKVLINGRMSDKSFDRYSKIKPIANFLLGSFNTVYAQSQQDYDRFSSLSSANIINSGNIKYDGPALSYDNNEFNVIGQAFSGRKILAVASTHKGEDEQVIPMYKKLKEVHEDLLMILIPRHPQRGNDIADIISSSGLNYIQRSKTKGLEKASTLDIYLADTLGEIGLWYELSDIVLMGGSFEWAGHNPLEPLKAGKPVYTGPNMQNFKNMTDTLIEDGVLFKYNDKNDLVDAMNNGLMDKEFLSSFKVKSENAVSKMSGATDLVIDGIRSILKEVK